jgi:hypothetical protein
VKPFFSCVCAAMQGSAVFEGWGMAAFVNCPLSFVNSGLGQETEQELGGGR